MSAASADSVRYLDTIINSLRLVHSAADDLGCGPVKPTAIERFEGSQRALIKAFCSDKLSRKALHLLEDIYLSNGNANPRAGEPLPQLGELQSWCRRLKRQFRLRSSRSDDFTEVLDVHALGAIRSRLGAVCELCELKLTRTEQQRGCPAIAINIAELMKDLTLISDVVARSVPVNPSATAGALPKGEGVLKVNRNKRRGRPRASLDEMGKDNLLMDKWQKAKESGVSQSDFCLTEGIALSEMKAIVDRVGKRKVRSGN